jgi:putative sigma-54 modulation protein
MNRKAKALEFIGEEYNIQITGRHVEVTPAMKDYAMEKVSKLERFTNRILDVNVIMDIQKLDHRVEIILYTGGVKMMSQANTTDMYVSIDQAFDKLEAQILRYKSKIQDYHAKGHPVVEMPVEVIYAQLEATDDFELDNEPIDKQSLNSLHAVVKQETRPLKILTYDEAVMKMELSGDMFLIFKNEADKKLKVIYRRKDNNYGIIEPSC